MLHFVHERTLQANEITGQGKIENLAAPILHGFPLGSARLWWALNHYGHQMTNRLTAGRHLTLQIDWIL
jgi:hypothetical protein